MSRLIDLINGQRAWDRVPDVRLNERVPATVQFRRTTIEPTTKDAYVIRLGLVGNGSDSVDVLEDRSPFTLGRQTYTAIRADGYVELARISFEPHPDLSQVELLDDAIVRYFPLSPREEHRFLKGYARELRCAIPTVRSRR